MAFKSMGNQVLRGCLSFDYKRQMSFYQRAIFPQRALCPLIKGAIPIYGNYNIFSLRIRDNFNYSVILIGAKLFIGVKDSLIT